MAKATEAQLSRRELAAWRGLLRTHARVLAELDAELEAAHALAVPEYEVLLVLTQTGDNHREISRVLNALRELRPPGERTAEASSPNAAPASAPSR